MKHFRYRQLSSNRIVLKPKQSAPSSPQLPVQATPEHVRQRNSAQNRFLATFLFCTSLIYAMIDAIRLI